MKEYEEWNGKYNKTHALEYMRDHNWTWLVVTDGANGIHVLNKDSEYLYFKEDIKEVSEKTLHTMHTMQKGGLCYIKDMVEAALENGKNTVPEIQIWIKAIGKDIAKTEIEITLKRLERF